MRGVGMEKIKHLSPLIEGNHIPFNLLLNLPNEIASSLIIAQYCDGRSLSTLLCALIPSDSHRRFVLLGASAAALRRFEELLERGDMPRISNSLRWDHVDFFAEATSACDASREAAAAGRDRDVSKLAAAVRRLSEMLSTLSFFEDDCGT